MWIKISLLKRNLMPLYVLKKLCVCYSLTGAEICNIINHAVISATNEERHKITAKDLESARDKVSGKSFGVLCLLDVF